MQRRQVCSTSLSTKTRIKIKATCQLFRLAVGSNNATTCLQDDWASKKFCEVQMLHRIGKQKCLASSVAGWSPQFRIRVTQCDPLGGCMSMLPFAQGFFIQEEAMESAKHLANVLFVSMQRTKYVRLLRVLPCEASGQHVIFLPWQDLLFHLNSNRKAKALFLRPFLDRSSTRLTCEDQ